MDARLIVVLCRSHFFLFTEDGGWESDDVAASLCVIGIEGEGTSQVGDMTEGQWESESQSFGKVVDLGEGSEHLFEVLCRDACSCVFNYELYVFVGS